MASIPIFQTRTTFINTHALISRCLKQGCIELRLRWHKGAPPDPISYGNKFLWIAYSRQPNDNTIDFSYYLAQLTGPSQAAIFLQADSRALTPLPEMAAPYCRRVMKQQVLSPTKKEEPGREYFSWAGHHHYTHSVAFQNAGDSVANILCESRMADLLVLGPETLLNPFCSKVSVPFITPVSAAVTGPVVSAPFNFVAVKNLIFCNDGSVSALFAMKQFTRIFPQYRNSKVIVLQLESEKSKLEAKERMRNWLRSRYSQVVVDVLEEVPEKLHKYLMGKTGYL